MDFFYDKEKDYEKIELHYLSNENSYGVERDENNGQIFYDSYGKLEKSNSQDGKQIEFKKMDFQRFISEKVKNTVYGEKYSNIVFLAGAGASVVGNNKKYGKTVRMIAENIFNELRKDEFVFKLEELAEKCKYNDAIILNGSEHKLNSSFNLEDFLSTIFHYRPFVDGSDREKFENTIKKILQLIKKNTNYSYNSKILKHGSLLLFLSDLSGKDGNKFSIVTTNYDVLIEQAAAENKFVVFDGFNFTPSPTFDSNMFEWNLVKEIQNVNTREVEFKDKTFNLIKIHGSLSWEKQENGDILRKDKGSIRDTDKMVMVFPSSDKFAQSYQEPYFELFTKFQELIKRPNTLLISSGFSFADVHISKMITQALKNNNSLKMLVTDFNIDPNREWNNENKSYDVIKESDSRYNYNWAELVHLMDQGYPISFLKATMNDNLVDYLNGRYLTDEN